ncbi:MAG: glucose-6-phosphate dehydrogenase assembly protein OpcA [Candidatus Zixiibacteriota bacterium]
MSLAPITPYSDQADSLPVNAEAIERRLHEIWRQIGSEPVSGELPIKVCLATCIIVTDTEGRSEAEELASQIARLHPSRILLVTVDDSVSEYTAYVATSCTRDPETHQTRCWEIIQIRSDQKSVCYLPGAVRSLVVESVPVVVVDYRPFQTTPELDATLARLTDFSFINAEVVPATLDRNTAMPFRWYRTFPARQLLGELFAAVRAKSPALLPVQFSFKRHEGNGSCTDLLFAWVLYRLSERGEITWNDRGVDVHLGDDVIRLVWREAGLLSEDLIEILFDNGSQASLLRSGRSDSSDVEYEAVYEHLALTRRLAEFPVSQYVISSLTDTAEFDEYTATCRVMMQYQIE